MDVCWYCRERFDHWPTREEGALKFEMMMCEITDAILGL